MTERENMKIQVIEADYDDEAHARDIVMLLSAYASDSMGGGRDLSDDVKSHLVARLAELVGAFSVLAYVDGAAAGLINCFEAFSTFQAKPLVNIHDVIVLTQYRGLGISQMLLEKVADLARAKGCCKLTLEVLEGNTTAQKAYRKFGFAGYELDPKAGKALFWQKAL